MNARNETTRLIELEHLGLSIDQQMRIPVRYHQKLNVTFIPDPMVDEKVVVG